MPGPDSGITIELSRPPEREADRESELRELERPGAASQSPERLAAVARLQAGVREINRETFFSAAYESAISPPAVIPVEAITDPTPNSDLRRVASEVRRGFAQVHLDSEKGWNADRWIAFAGLGIAAAGTAMAIYAIVYQVTHGGTSADVPISAEGAEAAAKLAKIWEDQSDQQYFDSLATYIETYPTALTISDQIQFMNFTALLASRQSFVWPSEGDKWDKVQAAHTLYHSNANSISAMYRQVTRDDSMKYNNAFLPRAIAAGVLQMALGLILIDRA